MSQQDLPRVATAALTVVLPVRNVADRLPRLLGDWNAYLDRLKRACEIIVVDDGSRDGTADAADALAATNPRLQVLRHPGPRGFGAALRTGIAAARHPLLFYGSADPAYRPADLGRLLGRMNKVHLVSGYRAGRPVPAVLRVIGFIWRWLLWFLFGLVLLPLPGWLGGTNVAYQRLVRWLFGVRVGDIDSTFKLFRRSVFDRIPIQSDGVFVHAEILAKANFAGCVMDEVAIDVPARWDADPARFADLRRVFRAPEFGPAALPKPEPAEAKA